MEYGQLTSTPQDDALHTCDRKKHVPAAHESLVMLPNPLRHPHARVFPSSSEVASERLDLCLEGCSSQALGKRHNDNPSLSAIALWCASLIHLCFTCHQRRRHIKPPRLSHSERTKNRRSAQKAKRWVR